METLIIIFLIVVVGFFIVVVGFFIAIYKKLNPKPERLTIEKIRDNLEMSGNDLYQKL